MIPMSLLIFFLACAVFTLSIPVDLALPSYLFAPLCNGQKSVFGSIKQTQMK
jgi:hypothetical protein